jgi:hypothetical protein
MTALVQDIRYALQFNRGMDKGLRKIGRQGRAFLCLITRLHMTCDERKRMFGLIGNAEDFRMFSGKCDPTFRRGQRQAEFLLNDARLAPVCVRIECQHLNQRQHVTKAVGLDVGSLGHRTKLYARALGEPND